MPYIHIYIHEIHIYTYNMYFIFIYCQLKQTDNYDLSTVHLHEVPLCGVKLGFK